MGVIHEPQVTTTTCAKPLRADARRNYGRLLAAAHETLTDDGPDASLDEIARRAQVGIGTLYRHFPTREYLIAAVMDEQLQSMHALATELLESQDAKQALIFWSRRFLHYAMAYRGVAASVLTAAFDSPETPAWGTSCQCMQADGSKLLVRAQTHGAVRGDIEFFDLARLLNGIALSLEHAPNRMSTANRLFDVVIDGILVAGYEGSEPALSPGS